MLNLQSAARLGRILRLELGDGILLVDLRSPDAIDAFCALADIAGLEETYPGINLPGT